MLNAGIALALTTADRGERPADFIAGLQAGMDRAALAIDEGGATSVLQRWVAATQA